MDEHTRRRVLGGTVAILGLSAGCQSLVDDQSETTPQYGAQDGTQQTLDAAQLLVGESPTSRPLISNGDRTLYIDPNNGDDSAEGTESAPLQTVQAAMQCSIDGEHAPVAVGYLGATVITGFHI